MPNFWNYLLKTIWSRYSEDVGKSLIHLGALGWFLSATAQIWMIYNNKNLDKKDKQFLLPQEISDGLVNVGLYYTICQLIKKSSEQLLEKGHILSKSTNNIFNKLKPEGKELRNYIEEMSEVIISKSILPRAKFYEPMTNFLKGSIRLMNVMQDKVINGETIVNNAEIRERIFAESSILKDTFSNVFKNGKEKEIYENLTSASKEYSSFKNGVGVISTVAASILACNIITPIARNKVASLFQKKSIEQTTPQKQVTKIRNNIELYRLPISKTFNNFKI